MENILLVANVKVDDNGKRTKTHFGPQHIDGLLSKLQEDRSVGLIIIDPAITWAARAGKDENKAGDVRGILDPLSELAESTNVAIVIIAHLNKGLHEKTANRVAGSAQYLNAVRQAFIIENHESDSGVRLLIPLKTNLLGVEQKAATYKLTPITPSEKTSLRSHPSLNISSFSNPFPDLDVFSSRARRMG